MVKIIWDEVKLEIRGVVWYPNTYKIRTGLNGRHVIADDNKLHGR